MPRWQRRCVADEARDRIGARIACFEGSRLLSRSELDGWFISGEGRGQRCQRMNELIALIRTRPIDELRALMGSCI